MTQAKLSLKTSQTCNKSHLNTYLTYYSHALNQKLRIQNEKLRSQLKELSAKLTETLERVKNKKVPEKNTIEFREDTLRKELENATKQLQIYQKENEKLKYKIETTHTHDR